MTSDLIQNIVREKRRERRFGPNPCCVLCGCTDPEALTRVRRTLLEDHHLSGWQNDGALTVVVCLNCHRVLTEGQRLEGLEFRGDTRTVLEKVTAVLQGLAVFFSALGERLRYWAETLEALVPALDTHCASWRELPEAYA